MFAGSLDGRLFIGTLDDIIDALFASTMPSPRFRSFSFDIALATDPDGVVTVRAICARTGTTLLTL